MHGLDQWTRRRADGPTIRLKIGVEFFLRILHRPDLSNPPQRKGDGATSPPIPRTTSALSHAERIAAGRKDLISAGQLRVHQQPPSHQVHPRQPPILWSDGNVDVRLLLVWGYGIDPAR